MSNNLTTTDIFERNVPGSTEIYRHAIVGIAGCGGLGSNAAVALARAGVGTLILADHDAVEASNLNRQHFFQADIGRQKVEALSAHLLAINPGLSIISHDLTLSPKNVPTLFAEADILIEAFDKAESKHWLIEIWCKAFPEKPIVCGNGLSGIGNTKSLRVRSVGNIHFCGDGESDMSMGLCSARVAIVANMEANVALELLLLSARGADDSH